MNCTKEIPPFRNFLLLLLSLFSLLLLLWVKSVHAQASASEIQTLDLRPALPVHLDTALTYFGPKDLPERDNYGRNIKLFLNSVGLPQGNPYCAAFVSYCLTAVENLQGFENRGGLPRSALASNFILPQSIDAKKVMYGRVPIPAGAIIVWRKGNTMFGHAGFVLLDWRGSVGITVEGNTTPGGNSTVEGVWIRERTIYPANYFRITNFTLVEVNQNH